MYPTYVLGWPTGHERGEYLTLDLGGEKLRICWVVLAETRGETHVDQAIYQIPPGYKVGDAEAL
jgi:hexokinase